MLRPEVGVGRQSAMLGTCSVLKSMLCRQVSVQGRGLVHNDMLRRQVAMYGMYSAAEHSYAACIGGR